jgi:UDP-2,3-diacylglucosamine hydrolase
MFHSFALKEGAIIVSDAHHNGSNSHFLDFLKAIEAKEIVTEQLIFLGDMFDTLFFSVDTTLAKHKESINILNKISKEMEIIYFEGNHDFDLTKLFPNINVIPLRKQPYLTKFDDKKIFMAHGDWGSSYSYMLYSFIIRNRYILKFLNMINNSFSNFIIKKLEKRLSCKDQCKEFKNFENHIEDKFMCSNLRDFDILIEGHYHQNSSFKIAHFHYINVASFACNQRYYVVKSSAVNEILQEQTFSIK